MYDHGVHWHSTYDPELRQNKGPNVNTAGKNIIGASKIRHSYGAIQSFIFPILR